MYSEGELVPEEVRNHPAWIRLRDQLDWYDHSANKNQENFTRARGVEIVLAAFIPIFSLADTEWSKWVAAILGAIITMLVGLRQLWRSDTKWMEYSAVAEKLKHEKYLFLAHIGPYMGLDTPRALRLLAERVEEIVMSNQGHFKWVSEVPSQE